MSEHTNPTNPKPPTVDWLSQLWRRANNHKIVQWSAAYVALAYAIQHAVILTSESFEWPKVVARVSMLLLALGLPVVITFAWYHGERTSSQFSRAELTIISILLVIGSLFFYVFVRPSAEVVAGRPAVQEAGVAAARSASQNPATAISLAVMPFVNLSGDPSQDYFSDGMTEEISGALAKIPDLRVVARSSAYQFKGKNEDARAVGNSLGATHLIEGSVRKAGDQLRISAELVRADNGVTIWSNSYDRQLKDVFAIQEDIARAITASLRMPLGLKPGENLVNSRTKDESTHEEFLRAKALYRSRGGAIGPLMQSAELLEQVVAREPDFSPAWAVLAQVYDGIRQRSGLLFVNDLEKAHAAVVSSNTKIEAAARRAVELDPKNADGYIALSGYERSRSHWTEAVELIQQAMSLDPFNPDGLNVYSYELADLGYVKRTLPMREQLSALDPLVPIYGAIAARTLYADGQYDRVIDNPAYGYLALAAKGQYREAADALEKFRAFSQQDLDPGVRLLRAAPGGAAPEKLPNFGRLSTLYAYSGAPERVMESYESKLKIGYLDPGELAVLWPPSLASVRKTERFKKFVRDAGLVDYWRAKGWPDHCHPTTGDDFACD